MSLRASVHIATSSLIAFFVVATTVPAQEQVTSLTGTITAADAGHPIAGATVMVRGAGVGTTTDASGHFLLTELEAGDQSFEIWRDGYDPLLVRVNLRKGETCMVPSGILELDAARTEHDQRAVANRRAVVERDRFQKWHARAVPKTAHMREGASGARR